MKRPALPASALTALLALLLLQAAPAPAQDGPPPVEGDRRLPRLRPAANPGAVIAAEIAFARAAQEQGQWTAFDATADAAAEMFVPQRTPAKAWLKDRANPPQAVRWQPHAVFASCDGSYAVTRGAWQRSGGTGWFSTVWHRQDRGKERGGYKWLLDQGGDLAAPLAEPEFVDGRVADCPPRPARRPEGDAGATAASPRPRKDGAAPRLPLAGPLPPAEAAAGAEIAEGRSDDGTLAWRTVVAPGGRRDWRVWLWKDGAMAEVIRLSDPETAPPPALAPAAGATPHG